jgi:hypothetical protein
VWEANAYLEVDFTDVPSDSGPDRALGLPAVIAMARDVLADLPRS